MSKAAKPRAHPTKKLAVRTAHVDLLMVPLVGWLNAHLTVTTYACCQGRPGDDPGWDGHPYVAFTCFDPTDLISVLSAIGPALHF